MAYGSLEGHVRSAVGYVNHVYLAKSAKTMFMTVLRHWVRINLTRGVDVFNLCAHALCRLPAAYVAAVEHICCGLISSG